MAENPQNILDDDARLQVSILRAKLERFAKSVYDSAIDDDVPLRPTLVVAAAKNGRVGFALHTMVGIEPEMFQIIGSSYRVQDAQPIAVAVLWLTSEKQCEVAAIDIQQHGLRWTRTVEESAWTRHKPDNGIHLLGQFYVGYADAEPTTGA